MRLKPFSSIGSWKFYHLQIRSKNIHVWAILGWIGSQKKQDLQLTMSTSARPTLVSSAPRQPASAVPAPPTAAFPPATPTRSHRADSDRWPTCKRADSPTRAPSTADSVADTVPVSADSAAATVPVSVDSDAAKIFFFSLSSYPWCYRNTLHLFTPKN